MPLSFPKIFNSAVPAPNVVLLPDAMFFVRAIPIEEGTLPADLATQTELALEALAPFPLAQLYYGYYHPPGSSQALLYAAYRKRFTVEQSSAWAGADLVIPSFVALLGGETTPGTTVVHSSADDLTALHWNNGSLPSKISTHTFAPEATEDERARVHDEVIHATGGSLKVINLSAAPVPEPLDHENKFVFRVGDFVSRLPSELTDQLDVRDKAALSVRRQQRIRDLILWRVVVGCAVALLVCLAGELVLSGMKFWQKTRLAMVEAQEPGVDKINAANKLVDSIGARSTDRLMPFEMVALVAKCMPPTVSFDRFTTKGNYGIEIEAHTSSTGDVSTFQTALSGLPACAKVELSDLRTRDNVSTFTLLITFKPEALKPTAP
jgi:hypothetical protein